MQIASHEVVGHLDTREDIRATSIRSESTWRNNCLRWIFVIKQRFSCRFYYIISILQNERQLSIRNTFAREESVSLDSTVESKEKYKMVRRGSLSPSTASKANLNFWSVEFMRVILYNNSTYRNATNTKFHWAEQDFFERSRNGSHEKLYDHLEHRWKSWDAIMIGLRTSWN